MEILAKRASGVMTTSGVVYAGPCIYFGFVCRTGGSNRQIDIYDNPSAPTGTIIETFLCDGNKPTDGHEHATPVICDNGLYLSTPGAGEAVEVYYWDFRSIDGAKLRY
jgi:hypothetical protein